MTTILAILVGGFVVVAIIALLTSIVGMTFGDPVSDSPLQAMGIFMVAAVCGLVFWFILLAISPSGPQLVVGRCYEAVEHSTTGYVPVTTGKTVIIIPYTSQNIDLVEVLCRG